MKTIKIKSRSISAFLNHYEVDNHNKGAALGKSLFLKGCSADELIIEIKSKTTNSILCVDVFEYKRSDYDDFCNEYKLIKGYTKSES